jgi:hypothetical protein
MPSTRLIAVFAVACIYAYYLSTHTQVANLRSCAVAGGGGLEVVLKGRYCLNAASSNVANRPPPCGNPQARPQVLSGSACCKSSASRRWQASKAAKIAGSNLRQSHACGSCSSHSRMHANRQASCVRYVAEPPPTCRPIDTTQCTRALERAPRAREAPLVVGSCTAAAAALGAQYRRSSLAPSPGAECASSTVGKKAMAATAAAQQCHCNQ